MSGRNTPLHCTCLFLTFSLRTTSYWLPARENYFTRGGLSPRGLLDREKRTKGGSLAVPPPPCTLLVRVPPWVGRFSSTFGHVLVIKKVTIYRQIHTYIHIGNTVRLHRYNKCLKKNLNCSVGAIRVRYDIVHRSSSSSNNSK